MLIKETEIEEMKENMSKAKIGKALKLFTNKNVVVQTMNITWNLNYVKFTGYVIDGSRNIETELMISLENQEIYTKYCPVDYFHPNCEHTLAMAMEINANPRN